MTDAINTKLVTGRRPVRYENYDELLQDAERLAMVSTRELGNWSKGQIFKHMAKAIDAMIDGPAFVLPAPMRWVFSLFMKKRMLSRTLDPGFKLPKRAAAFIPDETPTEEGLQMLRKAIARIKSATEVTMHPGFGRISKAEWDAFQLRHCEMHMSFILPQDS